MRLSVALVVAAAIVALMGVAIVDAQDELDATVVRSPCVDNNAHLLVLAKTRVMHMCAGGRSVGNHRVSLGRGGLNKRVEGDGKTPIGRYGLGKPRRSQNYLRFVPVEYPTAEQRREGFTGGAIGVHGPPRGGDRPGLPMYEKLWRYSDWTDGCIAVHNDDTILAIAQWVEQQHVALIELRDDAQP